MIRFPLFGSSRLLSLAYLFLILSACCTACLQNTASSVIPVGAMRDVMWKGELEPKILLDSLSGKPGLYGLGPGNRLSGELLILDGIIYSSSVVNDTLMRVEQRASAQAPFFVYSSVNRWNQVSLPDSVTSVVALERYLAGWNQHRKVPFAFKLSGRLREAEIHVVNLEANAIVTSPHDAHRGKVDYRLKDEYATLLGFYSERHKGIFTHHDSFVHIHLLTDDETKMGHVDAVLFDPRELKLFLPAY
jgi:acetolactate decarboxylase